MAEKTTIKINPLKPSKLDFDVTISGLDDIKPKVRFVICDVKDGLDWVAKCTKLEDDRWSASIPALTGISATTLNFRVEVVADEYFFTPAYGTIALVAVKDVEFESKKKPTVSASFAVSQDDEPPKKVPKAPKVAESFSAAAASSTGETGGGSSPTNALLSPEADPSIDQSDDVTNPGMYDVTPDDDPGEDDMTYNTSITIVQQTPGDTELPIPKFDPKVIAAGIVKSKMGSISRPATPGRLFNRDANGEAVVDGLESPDAKRLRDAKSAKVREILGSV